jgi:ribonuclease PH
MMERKDGRSFDELRPVKMTTGFVKYPPGSVLVEFGDTKLICAASVEEKLPRWMREQGRPGGWITGEYSMMPFASPGRKMREVTSGKVGGRTHEIQRIIGRSLRAVVNLQQLGERTIWIDCDVFQADGGTRTAAITGGFVALVLALRKLKSEGKIEELPIRESLAAVSVGKVEGMLVLDLDYDEDSRAEVDMNVVMTESGKFIELQGTAEAEPFTSQEMEEMITLARKGICELIHTQKRALSE